MASGDAWVQELCDQRDAQLALSRKLNAELEKNRETLSGRADNAERFEREALEQRRKLEAQQAAHVRRRRASLDLFARALVLATIGAFVGVVLVHVAASVRVELCVAAYFPAVLYLAAALSASHFRKLRVGGKGDDVDWGVRAFAGHCWMALIGDDRAFAAWAES